MKKLMLLSVLLVTLPQMTLVAQSVDDDLYFVPKKEKKTTSRGTEDATPAYRMESDRTTPAEVRFSSGQVRVSSSSPVIVTDASGVERNVDEYNRRYSYDYTEETVNDTLYIEDVEEVADDGEWVNGFSGTEDDYEYATRLIRFRSPRVAVPVSSPLYWDIVYAWPVSDWNVYTDGFYAYAFPTVSNSAWWSWRMDPWHWDYSWRWHSGWGFSFGWGAPWYDPWCSPWHYHSHYYHHHHHHPHHGFGPAWGGGHIGGGWRKGFYYDNRPRMASRPNTPRGNRPEAGVRATRGNDRGGASASRGNVATRGNDRNATATREARQGRVVSGRSSDTAVRGTTGRGYRIGDADDGNARTGRGQSVSGDNGRGRQEGTTVRSGRSSSSRSSGNYTRSSSTRRSSTYSGSAATRSGRSSGNVSSSRSSSSGSYTRGSSSSSRSSSGSYSSGRSSSRSSSGSYSSGGGSSRSSSGSYSSGGGSSRGSSGGGGGRSSGGGGRSGGGRR